MRAHGALLLDCTLWPSYAGAGTILFSESFDGPGLPNSLDYSQTDPFFTWSIDADGRLFADRTEVQRGVASAISFDSFALSEGTSLRFSADIGTPFIPSGEGGYNVGLVFGNYVAVMHPGLFAGAFRLEKIVGGLDVGEIAIVDNQDMGFTPALHRATGAPPGTAISTGPHLAGTRTGFQGRK